MDKQALIRLLGSGNTPAITVFGDFCLDKYLYIDAARDELSVETDLVAYQVTHQKMYAGAGGTITNNLRALGALGLGQEEKAAALLGEVSRSTAEQPDLDLSPTPGMV